MNDLERELAMWDLDNNVIRRDLDHLATYRTWTHQSKTAWSIGGHLGMQEH